MYVLGDNNTFNVFQQRGLERIKCTHYTHYIKDVVEKLFQINSRFKIKNTLKI